MVCSVGKCSNVHFNDIDIQYVKTLGSLGIIIVTDTL